MLNILTEEIIRIREPGGALRRVTLPGLYEALGEDAVESIDAARPHHAHAWHATLSQLGALALRASNETPFQAPAHVWTQRLRKLTGGEAWDSAWELVVPDSARPALLQPPSPTGLADYRRKGTAPDTIDVTITSKAHDMKPEAARHPEPDDWLSVLISTQAQGGYQGGYTYGVMRMNSGNGTRGCLGLAPADGGMGAHVRFDVERMLTTRADELARAAPICTVEEPLGLGWLGAWDGEEQLSFEQIDLWHVECCRRLRLVLENGEIVAYHRGVKGRRIDAESRRGVVGDFWTPVDLKDDKAAPIAWRTQYDRLWPLLANRELYGVPGAMRVPDEVEGELRYRHPRTGARTRQNSRLPRALRDPPCRERGAGTGGRRGARTRKRRRDRRRRRRDQRSAARGRQRQRTRPEPTPGRYRARSGTTCAG